MIYLQYPIPKTRRHLLFLIHFMENFKDIFDRQIIRVSNVHTYHIDRNSNTSMCHILFRAHSLIINVDLDLPNNLILKNNIRTIWLVSSSKTIQSRNTSVRSIIEFLKGFELLMELFIDYNITDNDKEYLLKNTRGIIIYDNLKRIITPNIHRCVNHSYTQNDLFKEFLCSYSPSSYKEYLIREEILDKISHINENPIVMIFVDRPMHDFSPLESEYDSTEKCVRVYPIYDLECLSSITIDAEGEKPKYFNPDNIKKIIIKGKVIRFNEWIDFFKSFPNLISIEYSKSYEVVKIVDTEIENEDDIKRYCSDKSIEIIN